MSKYEINYSLNVMTYNIYYKAMLGLDKLFLPQDLAQKNVKKIIKKNTNGNFIFGLQEVECHNKILPFKLSKNNYVLGKSGNDNILTAWSQNFKLLKHNIFQFRVGRPIQMIILKSSNSYFLIINLHAPHDFQDFGKYIGTINSDNDKYSDEIIRILNEKTLDFLKDFHSKINRVITLGDFNEFLLKSNNNKFSLDVGYKIFNLKTDSNKKSTCCLPNIFYPSDYIFDSLRAPLLEIVSTELPASDHLPIKSILK